MRTATTSFGFPKSSRSKTRTSTEPVVGEFLLPLVEREESKDGALEISAPHFYENETRYMPEARAILDDTTTERADEFNQLIQPNKHDESANSCWFLSFIPCL